MYTKMNKNYTKWTLSVSKGYEIHKIYITYKAYFQNKYKEIGNFWYANIASGNPAYVPGQGQKMSGGQNLVILRSSRYLTPIEVVFDLEI
jgi:hypothetical protein